ncbi:methyltransferase domain-containing protein [Zobellia galactanivorans]|uniref:SAM-dependent methyltransferase n=1 Tax=Zobellia galactanivorans (strain DSM 12802 / CCUG 47099 / CIP 106680 / NCIMB 13871 / Dsij) TaxID=63186 RepID=G0L080_ZOBGA|nr:MULTISPECIES: methyltransferase domain-containing protein [Zobellia]MBU3027206.1 methyltransferase domain-containing protein [Zobellia galactanivorans]MDO6807863.1 methyltransferase domain-containing protein [Zobellia galactanivorans]OWW24771.1 SAM-dependent methyltransferase [Zobellia sp. OII3]CAZ94179.1 SAM-dependent methyltransferase [Zobellia galactanivorans]
MNDQHDYWTQRYKENNTGWDIGYPSTPIKTYVDQLTDKNLSILIPGAGNAYEAEYLWKEGFKNVFVMDVSEIPLEHFLNRNPDFPKAQLLQENFFEHQGQYDLILEQTFFCSFPPTDDNRNAYARQMAKLLKPKGKLVGLWFDIPLTGDMEKRPFGGSKELYLNHLNPFFKTTTFTRCYNSIGPRADNELFGIFVKK